MEEGEGEEMDEGEGEEVKAVVVRLVGVFDGATLIRRVTASSNPFVIPNNSLITFPKPASPAFTLIENKESRAICKQGVHCLTTSKSTNESP